MRHMICETIQLAGKAIAFATQMVATTDVNF